MYAWQRVARQAAVLLVPLLSFVPHAHAATATGDASASVAATVSHSTSTSAPPASLAIATAGAADERDEIAGASVDARWTIRWARAAADAGGLPFAVVDKKDARLYVFDGRGQLLGQSPVLTGLARGDGSVPGIGQRPVAQIRPFERTTPAGRFVSQPGRNLAGESVVWVDYDTGIAIHRLRPGAAEAVRARSLATPTPDDNRQSYGCVVVPPAFFDSVVEPALGHGHGVVYVMPDEQPVQAVFGAPAGRTLAAANAGVFSAATPSRASR